MKGSCYIDNTDLYSTYGIFITEGGINHLFTFPDLVEPEKTIWPDENGIEVDLSNPCLKPRDITISFFGDDTAGTSEFLSFLARPDYRSLRIPALGREWNLRLSKTSSNEVLRGACIFSLTFVEDKIVRPAEITLSGPGVVVPLASIQIDGIDLSAYGIVISQAENDLFKMPSIKQNLTRSFSTSDGQLYDVGAVYFSEKEVTIKGTFSAIDISHFWNCYDAFFFSLIKPGERILFDEKTGISYPCYYKKSSDFKVISLYGEIFLEFSLTLIFTSCQAGSIEYLLAAEDRTLITTEDDYFIDLSRNVPAANLSQPVLPSETTPEESIKIQKRKISEMPAASSLDGLILPAVDQATNRNVHIPSDLLKKEEGGTSNVFQLSDLKDVDKNVDSAADGMVLQKQGEKWVAAVVEGGGSSGGGIIMKLKSLTGTLLTGITGGEIRIGYNFTSVYNDDGTETGGGTATYKVNSQKVSTLSIRQGDNYFDVSSYLVVGSNTVEVSVKDSTGATRTLSYTIELISLQISSPFYVSQVYNGAITFKYVPTGAISKVIHFILDGTALDTVTTSVSNRQLSYAIPAQSHGSHTLKVYMTADVNGQTVTSNVLFYDFICIVEGNTTPVIASSFNKTRATQYEMLSISFLVYSPSASTSGIALFVNNTLVQEQTVDRTLQTWNYRLETTGSVTLKITCANTQKTFSLTVTESSIDVHPEAADLELYLTSANRSNSDNNREAWSYNDINALLSDFNFKTNGWMSTGNSVALRVSGDARVAIPFLVFAEDFRAGGKTIEFEFETRDVIDYEAIVIDCLSGGIGLQVTAQEATFTSEQTSVTTRFKEEERVRVSFVVEKRTDNRLIYIYINGIMSGVAQYPEQDNFQQRTPAGITIGSSSCTVDLYNVRIYGNNLTQYQMLDNYIADIDDFDKKLSVYLRNKVYNDYGDISYNSVLSQLPCMIITGDLPTYKGDKKTVSIDYTSRQEPFQSFVATGVQIDVQGTSSQYYPRKNFKIKLKNGLTLSESGETKTAYSLRPDGIPATVFCTKADFAESSGTHNTGMAKIADKLLKDLNILTPPQKVNDKVRTTIDGFPICIFHRAEENGVKFVGKYNFNYDKGAEETFGFTEGAESWEFCNNTSDRVLFKSADFTGTDWMNDFEARYPDDDAINAEYEAGTRKPVNLVAVMEWVVSTANDTDKFKAEVANHFDLNNLLSYYLFTELFAMVDQRAKNMFLTRYAADGKWRFILYDNDTCLGINNEGLISFGYNVEYHDKIGTLNVWNGEGSVLWKNVETCFSAEIEAMYKDIRSKGYLSYDYVMSILNGEQSDKWCEAIYNADGKFKYIDPLVEEGNGSYLYAAQGSRKEHRKWWMYNRFLYMDSKYTAGDFLSDFATLRLYAPSNWSGVTPQADFTIVPFADEYIRVKYGSYIVGQRGQKDTALNIKAPDIVFNDTETIIYGASRVKSLGNLSGLYAGTIDVSKATRLSELIIGSGAEGYHNDNLTVLAVGANKMLRRLDIRNCPNLTQAVDLSGCENIEEVYAQGTGITSVVLPPAGVLSKLYLPGTVSNLSLKNQPKLLDAFFDIAGVEKLSTIVHEETPGVNIFTIVDRCLARKGSVLNRVRLIGIDATGPNLDTLYKLTQIGGIDEKGNNVNTAVVTGKYHATLAVENKLAAIQNAFPELTVTYTNLKPPTVTTFVFKSSQSKAITNSTFECNFEYTKYNEYTYRVAAEDDSVIESSFSCDNHGDYSGTYLVAGTRTQEYTITYIPLRTIRVQVYNQSVYPSGAKLVIGANVYITDNNGYAYVRSGEAISGTVEASGYAGNTFSFNAIANDITNTVYVYAAVEVKFAVKNEFGFYVNGATVSCDGKSGVTNLYGECTLLLGRGNWIYTVSHPDCYNLEGSFTVGISATTKSVVVRTNPIVLKPEENGNIQLLLTGKDVTVYISPANVNCRIDWGDGVVTNNNATNTHTYAENDLHQVEVLECMSVTSCSAPNDHLAAYWSVGGSKVANLTFYNSRNLIYIGDIFKNDLNRRILSQLLYNCTNLTSINLYPLGELVNATNILGLLTGCTGLTSVDLSPLGKLVNATNISYLLSGCTSLTSVDLSPLGELVSVTKLPGLLTGCISLTAVDLSPLGKLVNATDISYLLTSCTGLTSVDLSPLGELVSVTNISHLLYGCNGLTSVDLSPLGKLVNVDNIANLLSDCGDLTAVDITPLANFVKVTYTGSLLGNCNKLNYILCLAETPFNISSGSLTNGNNCPIYVPDKSVDIYKTATNWSAYADRILPVSSKPKE